ncbi:MAG: signal peptidase I [Clostridia bacterium]|nr:signal peptidase I [Clostridia bacterium]MBQ7122320.1 signal peptidase I [Clostridia bacterium]
MRKIEEFWIEFTPDEPKKANAAVSFIFDVTDSLKGAVIAAFVIFCLVFRVIGVEGTSMMPTLHDGDWVAVSGISMNIKKGDIVIITQPWERNVPIVKRVVAKGGDTVDIDFALGEVFVNGEKLNEPYIDEPTTLSYDVQFPLTVPEGKVFVMGDNRGDSLDSRSSKIGCIDERYILGKVMIRLYPSEDWKIE